MALNPKYDIPNRELPPQNLEIDQLDVLQTDILGVSWHQVSQEQYHREAAGTLLQSKERLVRLHWVGEQKKAAGGKGPGDGIKTGEGQEEAIVLNSVESGTGDKDQQVGSE